MKKCVLYFLVSLLLLSSVCYADNNITNYMEWVSEYKLGDGYVHMPIRWEKHIKRVDEHSTAWYYRDADHGAVIFGYGTEPSDFEITDEYTDSICLKYVQKLLTAPLSRQISCSIYSFVLGYSNRIAEYTCSYMNVSCYVAEPTDNHVIFFILIDEDGAMQRDFARFINSYHVDISSMIKFDAYQATIERVDRVLTGFTEILATSEPGKKQPDELLDTAEHTGSFIQDLINVALAPKVGSMDKEYRDELLTRIRENLYIIADYMTSY